MDQHRSSRFIIVCTSLVFMLPLSARSAPRSDDPCKQLHRDLDRQIDDVKAEQEDARDQCEDTYGKNSSECRSLADQQKQDLKSLRDSRKQRISGCTSNTFSEPFLASDGFAFFDLFPYENNYYNPYYNSYYDSDDDSKHHHHHHHHPPHHPPPPPPHRGGGGGAGTLASGKTAPGSRQ